MRRFLTGSLLTLTLLFCITAFSQDNSKRNTAPGRVEPTISTPQTTETYVIGPEDVLSIQVWHEPEFTTRVSVRPDGKIGVPMLNDMQAAGLTTAQLQQQIIERIKMYVKEPLVSVILLELHS